MILQTELSNSKHLKQNFQIFGTLFSNHAVQHVSRLANSGYKGFCPRMYQKNDPALRTWKLTIPKYFPNSVFAAATFNLGPRIINDQPRPRRPTKLWTWRVHHHQCRSFQWSQVGRADTMGLGDRNLDPCLTIIILSAMLRHSNLPIQPEQTHLILIPFLLTNLFLDKNCCSITQYSAGALFCFRVNGFRVNGFRNDKDF